MEEGVVGACVLCDGGDVVDDAGFVVGVDDGDEERLGCDGFGDVLWVDAAVWFGVDECELDVVLCGKEFCGFEYGGVFDG